MNPTDLVTAAAAAQEPLEADAIVEKGAWAPQTIRDVEWALEMAGESEAEVASIDEQEADAIARIKARADSLRAKAERRATYFKGRVAEFAAAHRSELLVGTKKSREFIAGVVAWRKKAGGLVVVDKAALQAWLSTQDPSLFRVKLEPEMDTLQKQFKETGIVPPGCDFRSDTEELTVKATALPQLSASIQKEMKP
jgi:phage host-nuclease inhibitor protein Gam